MKYNHTKSVPVILATVLAFSAILMTNALAVEGSSSVNEPYTLQLAENQITDVNPERQIDSFLSMVNLQLRTTKIKADMAKALGLSLKEQNVILMTISNSNDALSKGPFDNKGVSLPNIDLDKTGTKAAAFTLTDKTASIVVTENGMQEKARGFTINLWKDAQALVAKTPEERDRLRAESAAEAAARQRQ